MPPRLGIWGIAVAGMLSAIPKTAEAQVVVFDCRFPSISFFVTIYDDGSPARIGVEQGLGDKAQAYFDKLIGAWIIVEFLADGTLPSTLTTILKDGVTWHSRHTLDTMGKVVPHRAGSDRSVCFCTTGAVLGKIPLRC